MTVLKKTGISWLKYDYESISYFHATIMERQATNGIYEIFDTDGKLLTSHEEIHYEKSKSSITNCKVRLPRILL